MTFRPATTAISKAFGRVDVSYLRKWLIIAVLIGMVAGAASIVFYLAIKWATWLMLGLGAGYLPPAPGGEAQTVFTPVTRVSFRWNYLPLNKHRHDYVNIIVHAYRADGSRA
jgi:hypothetical protein